MLIYLKSLLTFNTHYSFKKDGYNKQHILLKDNLEITLKKRGKQIEFTKPLS